MILGIDEVGRGSWAGPLVVGAVVLGGADISGLTDSKKLTKLQRVRLDTEIRQKALGFGLGWVTAQELDKIGLSQALVLATKRAVEQINTYYDEIVIDGTVNFLKDTNKGKYVTVMKKADLLVPSVSAASIIAKVARDNYMTQQAKENPGYGFEKHVGYGTAMHSKAIDNLGVIWLHRLSFAPMKEYRAKESDTDFAPKHLQPKRDKAPRPLSSLVRSRFGQDRCLSPVLAQNEGHASSLSTKNIGNNAEDVATKYLIKNGHKILDRNWKTKYCEIDIVSRKNDVIFFTEVKYRKKSDQGGGLAAITNKKLRQMELAVKIYIKNGMIESDQRLAVMSLHGPGYVVDEFIEL